MGEFKFILNGLITTYIIVYTCVYIVILMGKTRLTSMRIDSEILDKAHSLGLNVTKIAENALKDAINRMQDSYRKEIPNINPDSTSKKQEVARERFELSSTGPKPDMLDHYTNGLRYSKITEELFMVRG